MCTPTLFETLDETVAGDPAFADAFRLDLDARSWVDIVPGWLTGAPAWFDELAGAPWRQRRRVMYERELAEPRLTCRWPLERAPEPAPALAELLGRRYDVRFDGVAANHYRDGADSVAWHGDRVRFVHERPVVAVVSLGAPRRFGLRPLRGAADPGADTRWLTLCGGDLLVMGGRSQHEWQHCVPKERGAGPRTSVTFRHDDPGPTPRPDGHLPVSATRLP